MLTRTQEEILERIKERKGEDFFGTEISDYIGCLIFENAKQFLKEEAREEAWTDQEDPIDSIKNYMEFAWGKANDQRGLSASRSISHMKAWLWLAGEDNLLAWVNDDENYYFYGKPILERICNHYGIDWKQWDDGIRTNG